MNPAQKKAKERLAALFSRAGVAIDGNAPHDFRVHDDRVFARILADGSLGLGESFMDGWWSADRLDEMVCRIFGAGLDRTAAEPGRLARRVAASFFPRGRRARAFVVGERHDDLGNLFFERMLDRRMIYSCAYWKDAANLDEAQERKLDLVCRKVGLKPGQKVLDIGCGWGGFARFAAERYGVEVTGVTVSKEQVEAARERVRGLPVEIRLQDYRDISGRFHAVVSLGMFEHVGPRHHRTFLRQARQCLEDEGLLLLHTIASPESTIAPDPWIEKYIFPETHLPSLGQITLAAEGLFVVEDVHNFG
ncbi:MAG TPA: cyclopropane fatty acyl phospholipid synthase, partial [Thermoanaerobaculia bacterium]|nr:cyclopropane fatty acyl phospholipid synthase [Thermoanaerobaculia bacterium]